MSRSDMAGTAHKLARLRGLTAQEIDPGSDAATEIEGLWNWLCAELHLGTLALVHKGRHEHDPARQIRRLSSRLGENGLLLVGRPGVPAPDAAHHFGDVPIGAVERLAVLGAVPGDR